MSQHEKVRDILLQRKEVLKMKHLAKIANINESTLSKFMNNQRELNEEQVESIIQYLEEFYNFDRNDIDDRAKIIAIYNNKGGVGKTTICQNIAAFFNILGSRVLLIDADPQGNLTDSVLGEEPLDDYEEGKIKDFYYACESTALELEGKSNHSPVNIAEVVMPVYETQDISKRFDVIPTFDKLERLQSSFPDIVFDQSRNLFLETLKPILDDYDYVFIDGAPDKGILGRLALGAADHVIIPVWPNQRSVKGIKNLYNMLPVQKRSENYNLGAVMNSIFTTFKFFRDEMQAFRENMQQSLPVFDQSIRMNLHIAQASLLRVDIFRFEKFYRGDSKSPSNGYSDFLKFAYELMIRMELITEEYAYREFKSDFKQLLEADAVQPIYAEDYEETEL
ncbi:AAA family ATPase [Persicobacter psychrovividus]|uniref:AAA domain-containing protein n=1 Tax=Persicobacter psychrovividus TaxID=387638 RepID=A0ABM7VJK5_9BACT|nr:hypothetical protein PEPS_34510 [Persicobacter psychrovividus]